MDMSDPNSTRKRLAEKASFFRLFYGMIHENLILCQRARDKRYSYPTSDWFRCRSPASIRLRSVKKIMISTKPKIVIADDEPDILNLLSILFRSKGNEVFSANDGETALNMIETNRPQAAILDFMMPKLDGITVCERIRQAKQELFIVIISGVGSEELKSHSDRAQADEYLEKPLRMAALVEKVKTGIARQSSLKEAAN